jgi:HD-GYP domain-containing protein (c-di-GMP phosphodiesterase class II)
LPIIRSANGVFSADLQIQAVAERSWDRAIELIAADCKPRQGRALVSLLRANQHLSRFSTLADLVQAILEEALAGLRAQRGALLLADPQTQKLDVKAVLAPTVAAQAKSHLPTLADRCFRDGQSILCQDVHTDPGMVAARSVPLDGMASVLCVLLRTPSRRLGVLHLDRGPLQEPFTESDLALADALAASVAGGIECAQVIEAQQREFTETVTTLAQAMEARDRYSGGHTKRVTDYALVLAAELNLPAPERRQLQAAGPLYDIGKIGIDDAILRKPGKLTPGEFEAMKSHTVMGAAMLEGISTMKSVVPIVRHHHERWDGTGYPDGLGHEQIALSARIMAVADAFDAMTSTRPYRAALPVQLAFREILNKAGAHFDPDCVQAFLRAHHRVDKLLTAHAIEALPSTTVCPVTVG